MVAVFLKTEIRSDRYDKEIFALLGRDGVSRKIVDEPDTSNPEENDYRIQLLGDFRGYKQNDMLSNNNIVSMGELVRDHLLFIHKGAVCALKVCQDEVGPGFVYPGVIT